jgi:hypothetical protein
VQFCPKSRINRDIAVAYKSMSKMLSKVKERISSEKLDELKLVAHSKAIMNSPFPQSICELQQIFKGSKVEVVFFVNCLEITKLMKELMFSSSKLMRQLLYL